MPLRIVGHDFSPGTCFTVHSPLLAMKPTRGAKVYVMLPVGTSGMVMPPTSEMGSHSLVLISASGELLLAWSRDLKERADITTSP